MRESTDQESRDFVHRYPKRVSEVGEYVRVTEDEPWREEGHQRLLKAIYLMIEHRTNEPEFLPGSDGSGPDTQGSARNKPAAHGAGSIDRHMGKRGSPSVITPPLCDGADSLFRLSAGAFTISYNGNMERNCEQVSTDYFGDILKKFRDSLK